MIQPWQFFKNDQAQKSLNWLIFLCVLARHAGTVIKNDVALPVSPLPKTEVRVKARCWNLS
jgi:hypothetical protein